MLLRMQQIKRSEMRKAIAILGLLVVIVIAIEGGVLSTLTNTDSQVFFIWTTVHSLAIVVAIYTGLRYRRNRQAKH
jgi:hypothetical protein